MGVCAAIKPDGVRCRARAMQGFAYCFNNNPEFADERRLHATMRARAASRGDEGGQRGRRPKVCKT